MTGGAAAPGRGEGGDPSPCPSHGRGDRREGPGRGCSGRCGWLRNGVKQQGHPNIPPASKAHGPAALAGSSRKSWGVTAPDPPGREQVTPSPSAAPSWVWGWHRASHPYPGGSGWPRRAPTPRMGYPAQHPPGGETEAGAAPLPGAGSLRGARLAHPDCCPLRGGGSAGRSSQGGSLHPPGPLPPFPTARIPTRYVGVRGTLSPQVLPLPCWGGCSRGWGAYTIQWGGALRGLAVPCHPQTSPIWSTGSLPA